jgi:Domain of unknown function (DUF6894)
LGDVSPLSEALGVPTRASERILPDSRNEAGRAALSGMQRFFFDLVGELSAHDFMGHECSSRKEAKRHASFIAHRVGTERPGFAKPGNYISVRDEKGVEIFEAPIKSTSRPFAS